MPRGYHVRMPARPNLPRIVTLALCVIIGLQLAWIVSGLLGSRDLPAAAGSSPGGVARPVPAAVAAGEAAVAGIVAARLFGDVAADGSASTTGAAPPTSLGLILVGVFAREDPEAGRAIIGESAAAARLHAVGATLPGGARLLEVHEDRVILGVGGQRETLVMPRSSLQPIDATPSVQAQAAAPVPSASPAGAMADPAQFVRWQAILKDGRIAGVRVYPGERAELFRRSGLQPGDLVTEINGTPLGSETGAAQFAQTLAASPSSTLRVERAGRNEEVRVDIARLMSSGAE